MALALQRFKKVKVFSIHCSRFSKEQCLLEGFQTSLVCPSAKSNTCFKRAWSVVGVILTGETEVWSVVGVILTGETEELGKKNCPVATLSTTNLTFTDLASKPGSFYERPVNNCLSLDTA
jgi:hypothetical protein